MSLPGISIPDLPLSPSPSSRKSRRVKPHIELAPDQPLTTQGKPRARVYVACLQWCDPSSLPFPFLTLIQAEPARYAAMVQSPPATTAPAVPSPPTPVSTTRHRSAEVRTGPPAHANAWRAMPLRRAILTHSLPVVAVESNTPPLHPPNRPLLSYSIRN